MTYECEICHFEFEGQGSCCPDCAKDIEIAPDDLIGWATLDNLPKKSRLEQLKDTLLFEFELLLSNIECKWYSLKTTTKYRVRHLFGVCDYCGKRHAKYYQTYLFLCPTCAKEEDDFQRSLLDDYDGE